MPGDEIDGAGYAAALFGFVGERAFEPGFGAVCELAARGEELHGVDLGGRSEMGRQVGSEAGFGLTWFFGSGTMGKSRELFPEAGIFHGSGGVATIIYIPKRDGLRSNKSLVRDFTERDNYG